MLLQVEVQVPLSHESEVAEVALVARPHLTLQRRHFGLSVLLVSLEAHHRLPERKMKTCNLLWRQLFLTGAMVEIWIEIEKMQGEEKLAAKRETFDLSSLRDSPP